ncbi:hypothetical protein [Amycolatopsis sp. NPDC051371]|uniref:hypothetical protein n=1 Tax=Amycolatopsis sp. NPDC051371 TaxID=3155800 RepID=UPI003421F777
MTTPSTTLVTGATRTAPDAAPRVRNGEPRRIVDEHPVETVVRVIPLIRARLFMPDDVAPDEGRVLADLPALPPVGTRILHDGFEYVVAEVLQETGNVWVSIYLDDV